MSKSEAKDVWILQKKLAEVQAKNSSLEVQLQVEIEKRRLDRKNLQAEFDSQLCEEIEKRKIAEAVQKEQRAHYMAEYEALLMAYRQAQRMMFGKKSERFVDECNAQQSLFETTEKQEEAGIDPADREEITYTRERRKGKRDVSGIPHREEVIPVAESERVCNGCGKQKEVIGYESSQRLDYKPAEFELVTLKREKVACRKGCCGVSVAPLPERILPKCKATESLLAYICVSKVLNRQPLYHLEKKIESSHRWHIGRQSMARWMIQLSDKLQPLVNRMKESVLDYDVAAIDATSLQVLNEPGRPAELKSYAYCIRGGPSEKGVILYEYNGYSTQRDYVQETLLEFKGVLHCDASSVYRKIDESADIRLSYCHAHARRKFEQVQKAGKKGKTKLATEAMLIYRRLYDVERVATDQGLSPEERLVLRDEKSRVILEEFKEWLIQNKEKTLPKSPIGLAIGYCLAHWEGLQTYLTDGRVEIDNNATERQIKSFVIARKNFLFACTQAGADALGVHFSLILTAKLHGWDPMTYYTTLLKRVPHCQTWAHYDALLPWNMKLSNAT